MRAKLIRRSPNATPQHIAELATALKCDLPMAELLLARGLNTPQQAADFLNPGPHQIHDPLGLTGMAQAVERIRQALDGNQRICIYGDYDVDGAAASAVLMSYLQQVGADAFFYIPHRHQEGYGLNIQAVDSIFEKGAKLLITVDCGITSPGEVKHAQQLGMDVIVTDHHHPLENLPQCTLINPKLPGQHYPYLELCGAGVAGKLVQALGGLDALLERMDMVALATVADVMPLTGENRAFVAMGVQNIQMGKCVQGIKALCEVAGVKHQALDAQSIAFALAPRINAGGRMGDSTRGARLLLAQTEQQAMALASELDEENQARRAVEAQIYTQAVEQVRAMADFPAARVLIITGDGWNEGVVGIVASRLVERYGRPVLLLSRNAQGRLTGSGRSIPALSLIEVLQECGDLFIRYGGHRQAAGLTMEEQNLPQLRRRLQDAIARRITAQELLPICEYDLDLPLKQVSLALVNTLSRLQPFGQANPAPMVCITGTPVDVRRMGSDNTHLRLMLQQQADTVPVVAFRMGEEHLRLSTADTVQAVVELSENVWQGQSRLQARASYIAPIITQKLPESWFIHSEEKVLRAFWDYIRYNMSHTDISAAAVPGYLPDRSALHHALRDLVGDSIEGTLILTHSRQALEGLTQALDSMGLSGAVTCLHQQAGGEERRFHSAVLHPQLCDGWHQGWKDILCFDGLPSVSLGGALAAHTGARVWVYAGADSTAFWAQHAALLQQQLDRGSMAALYKALRGLDGQRFSSLQVLAHGVKAPAWLVDVALTVFGELGFLDAQGAQQGRLVWQTSPPQRALDESAAYHSLVSAANRLSSGS